MGMSAKKKKEIEFQYYEIPHGERLLAMFGRTFPLEEGASGEKQRFHNLLMAARCTEGAGQISFGGKRMEYGPGAVAVVPQNISYAMTGESGWEYLFLNPGELLREFYPDNPLFAKKLLEAVNRKGQYYAAGKNERLAALAGMITEECRNKGSYSGEYVRGLLLTMLLAIARGGAESAVLSEEYGHHGGIRQISAAIEYVGKNYMEHIKMKTLAGVCNLSETHFRRLFAEYMDMNPVEYISLVRIHQACDLMKKTSYSMEEVAARVGYPAVSSFNRNFRRIIGTSPYQYKKKRLG